MIKKNKKFGIFILRAQPFHFGHQQIINEILLDGRTPIIIIGDDNRKDKARNPLSYNEIVELIELVYPNSCVFRRVYDNENWDTWLDEILNAFPLDNSVLYFHNKEADRYNKFTVKGKEYTNTFYTDIFKDMGVEMKPIKFIDRTDISIDANARDIRGNFCEHNHLIDARVFWELISKGWCSCGEH